MAKALRIDSLELLGNGSVRLTYTREPSPTRASVSVAPQKR